LAIISGIKISEVARGMTVALFTFEYPNPVENMEDL